MKDSALLSCPADQNSGRDDTRLCILEGRSMWPAFRDGDILLLKKTLPGYMKPGNVIAFHSHGWQKTVVHRVTGFRGAGADLSVLTQGDRSNYPDTPLRTRYIVGLVSGRFRNGSYSPCRRYQEIFWLYVSRSRRSFRHFAKYMAVQLTHILFPLLPVRVRTQLNDRFRT